MGSVVSARDEVLHNLRGYTPREDTGDDPAAQMLAAYRAEVLREAAEEIRAVGIHTWEGMSDIARAIRDARAAVADLIDPYTDDPTP